MRDMIYIGNRIRVLRNSLDLTGEEFGKLFNVSKVAVSNWENGNRTPDIVTLINIAKYTNVSIEYLLCISDDINSFNGEEKKYIFELNGKKRVYNKDKLIFIINKYEEFMKVANDIGVNK